MAILCRGDQELRMMRGSLRQGLDRSDGTSIGILARSVLASSGYAYPDDTRAGQWAMSLSDVSHP